MMSETGSRKSGNNGHSPAQRRVHNIREMWSSLVIPRARGQMKHPGNDIPDIAYPRSSENRRHAVEVPLDFQATRVESEVFGGTQECHDLGACNVAYNIGSKTG